ncbi:MAG: pyrroline-5-carboxylate reductase [Clostridia bacterium]|nr:pyrroline-5-carboxylate reductase [Clostridia bacterium]
MKLGFIGLGHMGSAILNGILEHRLVAPENIYVSRKHPELSSDLAALGIHVMSSNKEVAAHCDTVVLAVKPYLIAPVIDEMGEELHQKLVLSIAAGWTPERFSAALPHSRFICLMPNVPVSIAEGCTMINAEGQYTKEDMDAAEYLFQSIGQTHVVEDRIFSACGTLTGCGPAFVFEFIEALCDAAVVTGIPKALAKNLAAEMVVGSAKMVLQSEKHPCELKDEVCSPGGSTIEGIRTLHDRGFHSAVLEAVLSAREKGKKL